MQDPRQRFTARVENYVKYRPGYPTAVLDYLRAERGLTPASVVADIGSGTGLLSILFLDNGNLVYGVEPNEAMRAAAEAQLAGYANFRSVRGEAEATTLPDGSVDLVTAGQAFHWFEPARARVEFARILQPAGRVVLVWNDRRGDTPFGTAYEALLDRFTGEANRRTHHVNVSGEATLASFFAPRGYDERSFDNEQLLDFEGLTGRLLSSSHAPLPGHPDHGPMMAALRQLYDAHNVAGRVRLAYATRVYDGRLT